MNQFTVNRDAKNNEGMKLIFWVCVAWIWSDIWYFADWRPRLIRFTKKNHSHFCCGVLLKVQMPMQLCLPRTSFLRRFVVSSLRLLPATVFVEDEGGMFDFDDLEERWATNKLWGCQEAGEYSDIWSWFLWIWQWLGKSWLGSGGKQDCQDMSKHKSVAWRLDLSQKFDRRNHKRLLQRRPPSSHNMWIWESSGNGWG